MNTVRGLYTAALLLACAGSAHGQSAPPQASFAAEVLVRSDAKPIK